MNAVELLFAAHVKRCFDGHDVVNCAKMSAECATS